MLRETFSAALIADIERLSLNLKEMARAQTGGGRRSRARGSSVEFADYREYAPGDDFRRVDWNAYARLDRLYLKLFLEERESTASIFLDASASMDPESGGKADFARALAAMLAYLAACASDRAQVYAVRDGVARPLPRLTSKAAFPRLLDALDGIAFGGETRLAAAIRATRVPAGGASLLISDLFSQDDWTAAVKGLRFSRQDLAVVSVLSPDEADPSYEGRFRLLDSETRDALDVFLSADVLAAYARGLHGFHQSNASFCRSVGAAYLSTRSDQPLRDVLFGGLAAAGVVG